MRADAALWGLQAKPGPDGQWHAAVSWAALFAARVHRRAYYVCPIRTTSAFHPWLRESSLHAAWVRLDLWVDGCEVMRMRPGQLYPMPLGAYQKGIRGFRGTSWRFRLRFRKTAIIAFSLSRARHHDLVHLIAECDAGRSVAC